MDTGIKIIDKYSSYYFALMRKKGIRITREEIMSDLSMIYMNCKGLFNKDGSAKFDTYVIGAFKKERIGFLNNESSGENIRAKYTSHDIRLDSLLFPEGANPEEIILLKERQRLYLKKYSGIRLLIAKELIAPSLKVVSVVNGIVARRTLTKSWGLPVPRLFKSDTLLKAISIVYEIPIENVRLHFGIIVKKSNKAIKKQKKSLTLR